MSRNLKWRELPQQICQLCFKSSGENQQICQLCFKSSGENQQICQLCIKMYTEENQQICQVCIKINKCDECHEWRKPSIKNRRICQFLLRYVINVMNVMNGENLLKKINRFVNFVLKCIICVMNVMNGESLL